MSKEHINLVFIGHVDAGKSTLSGNLLLLTNSIDKRIMEKYKREAIKLKRESWVLAYIMDACEEEREKGKTVEVGRAEFETDLRKFTILDAPGHKNYIPNMIKGACQADIGILVISARKGEFETGFEKNGQTREHALLAKTLGISKLIVVVNKMDDKTVEWSESRFLEIRKKLTPYLRKYCGFRPKKGELVFVPISALNGDNIINNNIKDKCLWYDGECLINILNNISLNCRNNNGNLRIPIQEVYDERGTLFMGKIESGNLKIGDNILIQPVTKISKVIEIFDYNKNNLNSAKSGDNILIKINDSNHMMYKKGFVISSINNPIPKCNKFIAKINTLELLDYEPIITVGYKCIMNIHSLECEVKISRILYECNSKCEKVNNNKKLYIKNFTCFLGILSTKKLISIEQFINNNQLGRFSLRDGDKTIAIGEIFKIAK